MIYYTAWSMSMYIGNQEQTHGKNKVSPLRKIIVLPKDIMNEITQKYKPFCYYLLKMIRIFLLIPLAIIFHKLNIYLGNINGK